MKKIFLIVFLSICFVFMLTSCNKQSDNSDFPIKVGYTTINNKPHNVVVLSDNIADIIIANNLTEVIVGRSDECTQKEIKKVTTVGDINKPSVEGIIKLKPDLVLADYDLDKKIYDDLIKKDIKVFKILPAESDEELITLHQNICSMLVGKEVGKIQGRDTAIHILQQVERFVTDSSKKDVVPTACYLMNLKDSPITNDMYQSEIIEDGGAINVAITTFDGGTIPSTISNVIISDPDFIFCDEGLKKEIKKSNMFKNMKAVKKGNIFEYKKELMFRQGETLQESVEFFVKSIYGDIINSEKPNDEKPNDKKPSGEKPSNKKPIDPKKILDKYNVSINDDINLQINDSNDYVSAMQKRLQSLNYWGDNDITGYYGEISEKVVQKFKKLNNLDTTASGLNSEEFIVLFSKDAVPAEN